VFSDWITKIVLKQDQRKCNESVGSFETSERLSSFDVFGNFSFVAEARFNSGSLRTPVVDQTRTEALTMHVRKTISRSPRDVMFGDDIE
jgi:hypothetical protein